LGGRGRWISEFEASLVYRVSSRTARATQRNPVSKKKGRKKKEKTTTTKTKNRNNAPPPQKKQTKNQNPVCLDGYHCYFWYTFEEADSNVASSPKMSE
jgi:hypothetical protein